MQVLTVPPNGFKIPVLRGLERTSINRLRLQQIHPGKARRALTVTGQRPDRVFFLEADYVSVMVPLDGTTLSAGTLGNRSVIGAHALCSDTPLRHYYELPPVCGGGIYASPLADAQREFDQCEEFRRAVLSSLLDETVQAIQLCACNAAHTVEQRLARWLLLCHAELNGGAIYSTHEMVAGALGICRSTATTGIDDLQRHGILKTSRGLLQITDLDELELRACECYSIIRNARASFNMGNLARDVPPPIPINGNSETAVMRGPAQAAGGWT